MLRINNIGVILFSIFLLDCANCDSSKLLSVVTLYRHGSRGPYMLYKNDTYQNVADQIWPDGLSELTSIGKIQQFELGNWYRKHYESFIPNKYDKNFIRILSSDSDRCLMSAASNLAGLFPPKDNQIWKKDLHWQPIPIHTSPTNQDALLYLGKPCPKHDKLLKEFKNQEEYKNFVNHAQPTIKYIEEHSGEKFNDTEDVVIIHDALYIESFYGLELPKWSEKVYPNETMPIMASFFKLLSYTPQLARLKTGPLIDYITTFFEQVLEKPNNSQKFLMLSGHDSTITNFLTSVGLYDNSWPEYASSLNIELKSRDNQSFLNIFFRNSSGIHQLTLNDCIYDCDFDKFKKLTQHLRISPAQWDKECANV